VSHKIPIYPINPRRSEILGLPVYQSVSVVPQVPDLAVLVVRADDVPNTIRECGEKGVKRIVIISGGFKELGEQGAEVEKKAAETARAYGIRCIGPNCVGILNAANGMDTLFQPVYAMSRPQLGSVAVASQSGTYGLTLVEWLAEERIGVSKFVSMGNKCDVNELDILSYFRDDADTKVIAMYLEGLEDGRALLSLAREVSQVKPTVVMKAGRTARGVAAARSHTGSLAGEYRVFTGAMAQCGVIVADDVEEMFDIVKILALQPLPRGGRIAMITNGAGPCVLAADYIEESRSLQLAQLSPETVERLKDQWPPFFVVQNPIDITGSAEASHYVTGLEAMVQDPGVDIILPVFAMQDGPIAHTIETLHDSFVEINRQPKTLLALAAGGRFTNEQMRRFQSNGIPALTTATRAVAALDKIATYTRWLQARPT
jgi:acyl-CoA synthetase (NDP forming)